MKFTPSFTLGDLARELKCELRGDPQIIIRSLETIEKAAPGSLTFLSNPKYSRHLSHTRASAVIVDPKTETPLHLAALISPHPYLTFAHALSLFHPPAQSPPLIDPLARISPSAIIEPNVSIGPFSSIGDRTRIRSGTIIHSHVSIYPDVEIGESCIIHSHAVVREGCRLGNRVILQNHAVIGSDGFGYAKEPSGTWFKIPQTGRVIIEDDVEIGAGSTVDRATIGETVIGPGSKIDNLVQVGHGSSVGRDTLLCAQVGLAGSTEVGNGVILGGQVGAAGHLKIGDRVVATAQTGIPHSVDEGKIISGYPAIDNRDWLKSSAVFAQLPELQREVRRLKERISQLERDRA